MAHHQADAISVAAKTGTVKAGEGLNHITPPERIRSRIAKHDGTSLLRNDRAAGRMPMFSRPLLLELSPDLELVLELCRTAV